MRHATWALESLAMGFVRLDRHWRITYLNSAAAQMLGCDGAELLGAEVWRALPHLAGSAVQAACRQAMDSGDAVELEAFPLPACRGWSEVRVVPVDGGLALYFLDITERRRAQQASRAAAERAALLGRVSDVFSEHLDPVAAGDGLTELLVPALADLCIVSLVEKDPRLPARHRVRGIACRHVDPDLQPVLLEYTRLRAAALRPDSLLDRVLREADTVRLSDRAMPEAYHSYEPGTVTDLLDRLAMTSAAVVPLRARGRTLGLLSLGNGAARGALHPDDLATAHEVAARAALALDNAHLYHQQRDLAEGLQRSLLTAPSHPDSLEIVVRYTPAAAAAQVGGDWYDAFVQPDGATVLVIGDVVGHDTQAAAAMSQVRTMVRTTAVVTGDGPAEVLRRVDDAMRTLQVDTTATAVVARLEQTDRERARGITRLRWSSAGHLPPLVVSPGGDVLALDGIEPDLLLGVMPETGRHEMEVPLAAGTIVLLCTDGLVERRDAPLDDGLRRLADVLREVMATSPSLTTLCDEVLRRLVPEHPEDDVALLALYLRADVNAAGR